MSDHRVSISLLVDDSKESELVHKKFTDLGVDIEVLPGSGSNLPCAKVGNDLYCGRSAIDFLIAGLSKDNK